MSDGGVTIGYDFSLAILSIFLVILVIVLIILCRRRRRRKAVVEHREYLQVKLSAIPCPLVDVHATTDGFNPRRIIGKGRLGTVYIAIKPNGDVVAVKRINSGYVLSNAGFGFSSIMKSLSLAHHPNIVPIIGFSEAPGERIIMMEFMGMKSLEFYLHQNSIDCSPLLLDWKRRLQIAAGVARGIEYLHERMNPSIIHGCIKPSNILLDVNFCARICDYGLTFLAPQERRGLIGYADKEYWNEKKCICKASDVYGFGVVLLELLSGRMCQDGLLVEWALPLIRNMRIVDVLDSRLLVPFDIKPLIRLAKVASACVSNSRQHRPSIVQVTAILNSLEMEF
ncbi:Receptor-like kinase lip2 [Thalictrum thalictroides]|uniref:Receptor-like kinase lip2 n=1 Tax=Thalictrum thalictroides TaxID=46969 RepID=A0A7J6VMX8_THATH|nr:Receptor-like kinase lip2 [Thalictrum thalictroides]